MASPVIQRSPVPSSSSPLQRLSTFKDRTTNTPTSAIATPQSSITPATAPLSLSSPLDSFASDPIFSAFLSPDFDSTRFSSAALSSGSVAALCRKAPGWHLPPRETAPLRGCRKLSRLENLEVLDLGGNDFNNSILPCLSAISTLKNLSLDSNSLEGLFPIQEFSHLKNLEALDISYNKIRGSLSFKELATLGNMVTLDLCGNQLSKVSSIEAMSSLKALSFYYNKLSDFSIFQGEQEEVEFTTKSRTYSYGDNKLSGRTPEKGQFATFDESNYEGNPDLCGPLLKRSCSSTAAPPTPSSDGEKNDTAIDMEDFYWSFMASYIIVLSALLVILCINPPWRRAWFRLIHLWILRCFIQY
ncbi:hypothetical protein F0562_007366 [Nyssa sinensis]|uniref:Leucine-rich repeat-containing N-terminal plant-type domain-containing protein n=1 Tax=Nyssa sinensis TaxID=561372 RepID=A0A5J5A7V1_9ASTE|nr:hypothetical protein F0562_007366 [Nyssa sinensis]